MKKTFGLSVVATLIHGRMLDTGFDKMHELAEHVAGHPIWTHEFAEKALWKRLREEVFTQHPVLRDLPEPVFDVKDIRDKNLEAIHATIRKYIEDNGQRFGAEFEFEQGSGERTESPIESAQRIAPGKPVIGVVVDE